MITSAGLLSQSAQHGSACVCVLYVIFKIKLIMLESPVLLRERYPANFTAINCQEISSFSMPAKERWHLFRNNQLTVERNWSVSVCTDPTFGHNNLKLRQTNFLTSPGTVGIARILPINDISFGVSRGPGQRLQPPTTVWGQVQKNGLFRSDTWKPIRMPFSYPSHGRFFPRRVRIEFRDYKNTFYDSCKKKK